MQKEVGYKSLRFQRTYEELKRNQGFCHDKDVFRFQRTYEELKQKIIKSGHESVLGFQRTYEELKPVDHDPDEPASKFLAYLRGIETLMPYKGYNVV